METAKPKLEILHSKLDNVTYRIDDNETQNRVEHNFSFEEVSELSSEVIDCLVATGELSELALRPRHQHRMNYEVHVLVDAALEMQAEINAINNSDYTDIEPGFINEPTESAMLIGLLEGHINQIPENARLALLYSSLRNQQIIDLKDDLEVFDSYRRIANDFIENPTHLNPLVAMVTRNRMRREGQLVYGADLSQVEKSEKIKTVSKALHLKNSVNNALFREIVAEKFTQEQFEQEGLEVDKNSSEFDELVRENIEGFSSIRF